MTNKQRIAYLVILIILIPLGFYLKEFTGQYQNIVNNKFAGSIYVMFWSFLAILLFPKSNKLYVLLWVLAITIGLEFTQFLEFPWLLELRKSYIIKALIGSSFTWSDIPYYLIGSIITFLLTLVISNKQKN